MDDRRLGLAVRSIRRRKGLRQRDLAVTAGVSQAMVSRIERGMLDATDLRALRAVLAALEANLHLELQWHGAGLDRLLDERHAAACGVAGNMLREAGWEVAAEVSFSIYGERGSVDLLGGHASTGTVLVSEVKSDIGSGEQTLRSLDVKTRLAMKIAEDRFGWRPRSVARVLIVIASTVNRDRIARLGPLFGPAFPTRGVALRRWLRAPQGSMAGLWFVGLQRPSPASHPGRERIRVPVAQANRAPRRERPWGTDA